MNPTTVSIGKKQPITLTEAAQKKVAQLIAQEASEQELYLRVAVKPGGCSGYSYDMYFDTVIEEDDIVTQFGDVKVVIDPDSANLIRGSTLDYSDSLSSAGFHITNPNATRTCGCGSSFS
jgi:iron-sulfur cluster assembly accessory protein